MLVNSIVGRALCASALALAFCCLPARGQTDDEAAKAAELAKKALNPVASLISVPVQNNWDFGIGSTDAMRYTANVQPVIPLTLTKDWNLITRTILPIVYAESTVSGGSSQFGLGDILQSFFFSPKEPAGGWIVGAGPVLLYPSATNDALGAKKWGAGPTLVVLKQQSGFTYGVLANHIWSYAGSSEQSPDLWVAVHARLSQQTQVTSHNTGYGYGYRWRGGVSTATVEQIPVGSLIVDLADAKQKELVWRGMASDTLNPEKSPEDKQKALQEAL
ncbi:MAG: DUF4136 domain-containing protein, partial [Thermoanaerobaculia bacterium]